MLNRRALILGGCCAAHAANIFSSSARAQASEPFMCKTVNSSNPDELVVTTFANTEDQLAFEKNQKNLNVQPFGTSFLKDRWLPTHVNSKDKVRLNVCFLVERIASNLS